ncbi:pIIIa protein [Human adenovirus 54]|uniref:Pre-hexon-linking protein IIIa n=1 Tax=Human adenovirus 54 TaxID=651580 RepID=B9A5M2_9ADEN|nr:pIIIa [Human adenovirus 54]BAH18886.1 pIIIa [Human adenovirus 54]BAH84794.1 pIIIa [Human adenovirus 54]BAX64514.1 pIIIa protein [Human adenovirus 54]BAX64666.1 pIIIa protein [Human adenovirus 54]BAX65388.1 pIIIa protein [Human adenovirus 54]
MSQQQAPDPAIRAALQSQPSGLASDDWEAAMQRIMALTTRNPESFRQQPQANRLSAILEAVVPSRTNPTHEKVLAIVNALAENKAIRPDEAGLVYNALLERVGRYNSTNVQSNLDRLVTDVREAVAQRERFKNEGLGSLVALNAFLATQPANVPRGQDDYTNFISALRLMVTEVPQSEVYQSGPDYFFQTSRQGLQTVNLSQAFKNLRGLWGVQAPVGDRSTVSSLLTPNSRLLLLLIAPFTDSGSVNRNSYLGHLLTLYREAIGQAQVDEQTFQEITSVSRALGQNDTDSLRATLNFLLTNRQQKIPPQYALSAEEERILRYVQQSVGLFLMQEGATPSAALDMTARNMEPSMYAANRPFINKLMDYLHRAASMNSDYFTNAILNPHWLPPPGFYTGEYDMPDPNDGFLWDDVDSAVFLPAFQKRQEAMRTPSEGAVGRSPFPSLGSLHSLPNSVNSGRVSRPHLLGEDEYLNDSLLRPPRAKNAMANNGIESLVDKLNRWKTYAQDHRDAPAPRRQRHDRQRGLVWDDEDSADDSSVLDLGGSGGGANPFAHLQPRLGQRMF